MPKNRRNEEAGFFGVRHLQALMLFFCLVLAYAMRVNLSVAIVAMTDRNSTNPDFEEYDWNEKTKSVILSSFFWGYVVTQIPAGQLAERYGPKLLLLMSITLCSMLNILTPFCAHVGGWKLVCGLRVIQGLCQGFIFPSSHTLISRWAPISERAQIVTYCYSGAQFGTVLMLSSSGMLASSQFGWPSIFYISGSVGFLWSLVWWWFGASSPAECKSITREERAFIEVSDKANNDEPPQRLKTPWKAIFTSLPFISVIIVHSTHNWGFWTLLTEMPTYFNKIMGLNIKENALLSALPYLGMYCMSFVFSAVSSMLIRKGWVPLKYNRKLFNSLGHWIPMCALIALGYVTKSDKSLAIILLTIAVSMNAATYLGFNSSHIDLAPNFAGTLMGITNCAANVMSILGPLFVGFIVEDETDPTQWRKVFFIAAGIYFFGNLVYVIFCKTSTQPWNEPEKEPIMANGNQAGVVVRPNDEENNL